VRGLILGIAAVCYVAALVIAGAGMRLPAPQPTRAEVAAPTPAPAQPILPPVPPALSSTPFPASPPAASTATLPASPPASAPAASPAVSSPPPPAVALPQVPAGNRQPTIEDLAREQAASRQLVTELRATVSRLQGEIACQSAALKVAEPQGRIVTVLCCDLLPPGQETPASGARAVVRAALPEINVDIRQLVSVEGHTDSRPILVPAGKPFKDNTDLSLLRARAVAALLQQQGVAAARIRVKGWGDTRPLASNDTAEGRDRNRRVEIRLIPPAARE